MVQFLGYGVSYLNLCSIWSPAIDIRNRKVRSEAALLYYSPVTPAGNYASGNRI